MTDDERIASISNPQVHSGDQEHLFATIEEEIRLLGNSFCYQTLKWIYPGDGVEINWVTDRPQKPVFLWRNRYIHSQSDDSADVISALAARMKLVPGRASALTDGELKSSFAIAVNPSSGTDRRMKVHWRFPTPQRSMCRLSKAKRFY